jgi:hypothetical protein
MTTGALHVDLPGEVIHPGDTTYDGTDAPMDVKPLTARLRVGQ